MKKILLAVLCVFGMANAQFKGMSEQQVQEAMKRNVPIIDVRTAAEWEQTGILSNSHKITFFDEAGKVDINKWMSDFSEVVKSKDQEFILVCRSSGRTKKIGRYLSKQGFENVYELSGGINSWQQKGLPTEK